LKRSESYIGVAGVTNRAEAQALLQIFHRCIGNEVHKVMTGVLASSRTLRGERHKKPNRFSAREAIKDIFIPDPKSLNVIHFATDGKRPFSEELIEILDWCVSGWGSLGVQLNVIWPSPREVEKFLKAAIRKTIVVLQIGTRAFKEVNNSPCELAKRLGAYRGLITHVLLDPSGGEGKPLDPAILRPYVQEVAELSWPVGVGVAGGLSPTTLHLVQPLFDEFPFLSIDAETGLRTEDDFLDLEKVRRYIEGSLALLKT